jgi:hypothetical protein
VGSVALSEEKKESWFSGLRLFLKVNPLILISAIVLMNLFSYVYNSEMQFHLKFFALVSIGFFYLLAIFYEFYRIEKEKEAREKGLG